MTKSLEKQLIDRHGLSGKKFGRWTVVSYVGAGVYNVQCDCGHSPNPYDPDCLCLRRTIDSARQ